MKRSFALVLGLLFLSSTGMVMADTTATATHVSKVKHHKKGGKGKPKSTLNPQPLPPRVAPGTNPNAGAPGGDKSEINKNQ